MIVSINPNLFDSEEEEVQLLLANIVDDFFEDKFIWDVENVDEIFYSDNPFERTLFFKRFMSQYEQKKVSEKVNQIKLQAAYQTNLHNKYLTRIYVGLNKNEISPFQAAATIRNQSVLILENGKNDWNFISGIVKKYRSHKTRKNIYKLIEKSIERNHLIEDNAGGLGNILHRKDTLSRRNYKDIFDRKVVIIFDSDRENMDNPIKNEQKKIIKTLKNKENIENLHDYIYNEKDVCCWHMLYKRGIENYMPMSVLFESFNIGETIKNELEALTPSEFDFYYFNETVFAQEGIDVKNELPKLFLGEWTKDLIEQRCAHHLVKIELPNGTLEDVTEIEEILLKIAKII